MKVVKPTPITDARLVASSVPENDYPAWNAGTNYAVADRVLYGHTAYECVQTPNTGNNPGTAPLYWAPVGTSNRWAMFDSEIATQTVTEGPLVVTIKPGYVNSLALFGLEGLSVGVIVRDGLDGQIVYDRTMPLDGSIVLDWYQYFFEPIDQLEDVVLSDLPPYSQAHITVTVNGLTVKCGMLAVGTAYDLGKTQRGVGAGIIDYSRKDTDASGRTTFVKRRYSKRMSAPLFIENATLNKLYRVLASLRATPCVWIGIDADGFQLLNVFGFYRDFSIDVAYPTYSHCTLEIEGLT